MQINTTQSEVETEILKSVKDPDGTGTTSGPFKDHNFNSPLSGPMTLVRALARVVYLYVDQVLVRIIKAIHPHSAEPDDLYEHAANKGIAWKQATKTKLKIRIGSATEPPADRPIPQGLIIRTDGPDEATWISYRLLNSATLYQGSPADIRGSYTIEMLAECLIEGPRGNVVADSISVIENPPTGIDTVYNPSGDYIVEGRYKESVASIRDRLSISEESGSGSMWTPAWYRLSALAFEFCNIALFKSAKSIGMDGFVQLLVRGPGGALTIAQLDEMRDWFASEENNPGGAAHVLVENLNDTPVDKSVVVYFNSAGQVPTQQELDDLATGYFLSLSDGEPFEDAALTQRYSTLDGYNSIAIAPPGDVSVPVGSIAVQGAGWSVSGGVFGA